MSPQCVYSSTTMEIHKNPQHKDGTLQSLLEIECPNNLFMVLQSWKFILIQNVKDGISELLYVNERPHSLCIVVQSWKFINIQSKK